MRRRAGHSGATGSPPDQPAQRRPPPDTVFAPILSCPVRDEMAWVVHRLTSRPNHAGPPAVPVGACGQRRRSRQWRSRRLDRAVDWIEAVAALIALGEQRGPGLFLRGPPA